MEQRKPGLNRERWHNLGWAAYVLCCAFGGLWVYIYPQATQLYRTISDKSPILPESIIGYILAGFAVIGFHILWELILKSYCFARAETAEKCKLFDYLKSDGAGPVREQLWKGLFDSALVLLVLLTLLGAYCVLRLLF